MEATILALLLLLTIAAFAAASYFLWSKGAKRDVVLLLGSCDSGKTMLFSALCHGFKPLDTVTSIKPSIGLAKGLDEKDHPSTIVDVPGHSQKRNQVITQFESRCKGIIFMIDSITFNEQVKDVAEYLYSVLSLRLLSDCPVIVLCNKQDFTFRAAKPPVIKAKLESEFTTVRKTKAATLSDTSDEGDTGAVQLGGGDAFQFSDLRAKCEFIDFVAKPKGGALAEVGVIEGWLSSL